jgi:chemotaxis protein histidine kinase CheA
MDVEGVPAGMDFIEHIKEKVSVCDVFLAIIGPNWLNARDEMGNRRLETPDDLVAVEIAAALKRNIPVVPVTVDGARPPRADELPDDIKTLARRHAVEIRTNHFRRDAQALTDAIRYLIQSKRPMMARWILLLFDQLRRRRALVTAGALTGLISGLTTYYLLSPPPRFDVPPKGNVANREAQVPGPVQPPRGEKTADEKEVQDLIWRGDKSSPAPQDFTPAAETQKTAEGRASPDAQRVGPAAPTIIAALPAADAQRVAEAKAAEERQRVAAAAAEAQRIAEAKAAADAQRAAETKARAEAQRVAEAKAAEAKAAADKAAADKAAAEKAAAEAQRVAQAKAAADKAAADKAAAEKAAAEAQRVAEAKAAADKAAEKAAAEKVAAVNAKEAAREPAAALPCDERQVIAWLDQHGAYNGRLDPSIYDDQVQWIVSGKRSTKTRSEIAKDEEDFRKRYPVQKYTAQTSSTAMDGRHCVLTQQLDSYKRRPNGSEERRTFRVVLTIRTDVEGPRIVAHQIDVLSRP